jgi:hypothetical protein
VDLSTLIEHYPIAARGVMLSIIFASGYVEAVVWKARALACSTWFICLLALTIWIAYLGTLLAIAAAAGVFVFGLLLLIGYYQFSAPE